MLSNLTLLLLLLADDVRAQPVEVTRWLMDWVIKRSQNELKPKARDRGIGSKTAW